MESNKFKQKFRDIFLNNQLKSCFLHISVSHAKIEMELKIDY